MDSKNKLIAIEIFAKRAVEELVNTPFKNILGFSPYTVKIDNISSFVQSKPSRKGCMGFCSYQDSEIGIAIQHVELSEIEEVKDTILHEIAHARAFWLHGSELHDTWWKQECEKVGATPKATKHMSHELRRALKIEEKKWTLISVRDNVIYRHGQYSRKPKNLKNRFIRNDPDTLGNLYIVDTLVFNKGCATAILENMKQ